MGSWASSCVFPLVWTWGGWSSLFLCWPAVKETLSIEALSHRHHRIKGAYGDAPQQSQDKQKNKKKKRLERAWHISAAICITLKTNTWEDVCCMTRPQIFHSVGRYLRDNGAWHAMPAIMISYLGFVLRSEMEGQIGWWLGCTLQDFRGLMVQIQLIK